MGALSYLECGAPCRVPRSLWNVWGALLVPHSVRRVSTVNVECGGSSGTVEGSVCGSSAVCETLGCLFPVETSFEWSCRLSVCLHFSKDSPLTAFLLFKAGMSLSVVKFVRWVLGPGCRVVGEEVPMPR